MAEWENPYAELQRNLRSVLHDRLRRTNGCVSRQQFMECVKVGSADRAEKLLLRLFTETEKGLLEWKPEIDTVEVLTKKLGGIEAVRTTELTALWSHSRKLRLRTTYPYLAPAGKKNQHVSYSDFSRTAVFGLDVLVRPPTEFSEDRGDKKLQNGLVLGEENIALVAHGTFENGRLVDDGEYFSRIVVGDAFNIPNVWSLIAPAAGRCERDMRSPLRLGDAAATLDAALPHLNNFAQAAAMAFIN
jgi:hypothetical protein